MDEFKFKEIFEEQQAIHNSIDTQNETPEASEASQEIPDLSKLEIVCETIENDFENLDNDKLSKVLNILNNIIELKLKKNIECDIGTLLDTLIDQYKNNGPAIKRIIQLIYQILYTMQKVIDAQSTKPRGDICKLYGLHDAIFMKLIKILLNEPHDRVILTNSLVCLQNYLRLKQSNTIVEQLWLTISESVNVEQSIVPQTYVQVLVQLFDEFVLYVSNFHKQSQLIKIIQYLILSDHRDERRAGGYLLKKVIDVLISVAQSIDFGSNMSEILKKRWTTYTTILDNLEDNQSHLILPALEMLESVNCQNDEWYKILLKLMLKHQNILVLRWTLEYILKKHNCTDLDGDILWHFMEATNRTNLFNRDGYFLPRDNIYNFFKDDVNVFVQLLGSVNWKSVPLHFWIEQLHEHFKEDNKFSRSLDSLLAIAFRVRASQNTGIRRITTDLLEEIFCNLIENLTLKEYLVYIETINNSAYNSEKIFRHYVKKLQKFANSTENICSQHIYEIIHAPLYQESSYKILCSTLSHLPKEKHGYLRFAVVFNIKNHSKDVIAFCSKMYNIDLLKLRKLTLNELREELTDKLVVDQSEQRYVNDGALNLFIYYNVTCLDELIDHYGINVERALERASILTVRNIGELYARSTKVIPKQIWNLFLQSIEKWKMYDMAKILFEHLRKYETVGTIEERADDVLQLKLNKEKLHDVTSGLKRNVQFYIDNILCDDIKTGEARIEELYEYRIKGNISDNFKARMIRSDLIPKEDLDLMCHELFARNEKLSAEKPRYYENSRTHILKMRIAYNILDYSRFSKRLLPLWHKDVWFALLKQNNQLNITYFLEYLAALFTNRSTLTENLDQISTFTSSQQVSIVCVAHAYCKLHELTGHQCESIFMKIFPLSMGDNFQVRLYAQLASLSILTRIDRYDIIQQSLRSAIGNRVDDLLNDLRLTMCTYDKNWLPELFMYITNAPIDEYDFNSIKIGLDEYALPKTLYTMKISNYAKSSVEKSTTTPTISPTAAAATAAAAAATIDNNKCNAQRKMNPLNDIIMQSDLKLPKQDNESVNHEFYVVASLVDKLPNLGGIARTCEVFGIKNFIVNNKTIVDKSDFKHLSMTAEKSLNIIEVKATELTGFLMQKQADGFKIIGAEQTAESVTFVNFEFPKKCILLLGHEKEGIPANLLGFLDAAVEIPQFGNVRSLNVHVTGALFMWEYCKQHIIKN